MSAQAAIKTVLDACDQDPALNDRLLHDPKAVVEERGVTLSNGEAKQLKRAVALMSVLDEFEKQRTLLGDDLNFHSVGR